jgi:hypothetical protein
MLSLDADDEPSDAQSWRAASKVANGTVRAARGMLERRPEKKVRVPLTIRLPA